LGELILGRASCLDAFSNYLFQRQRSSSPACTVLSTAFRSAVRLAFKLPGNRLVRLPDQRFKARRSYSPKRDHSLVTAFHSPAMASACADPTTGSMIPACYFAHSLAGFSYPFGFSAPPPGCWFAPASGYIHASSPLHSSRPALPVVLPASAPPQEFSFL
jgi:hypothetical protein